MNSFSAPRRARRAVHHLSLVSYLVADYDEAAAWLSGALGFVVLEDRWLGPEKRWLRMAPRADSATALLLAKAATDEQRRAVGRSAGGRVAYFLETDDFVASHARMSAFGVRFAEEPRREAYGRVAVFLDLYGNRWDLIEPANPAQ